MDEELTWEELVYQSNLYYEEEMRKEYEEELRKKALYYAYLRIKDKFRLLKKPQIDF